MDDRITELRAGILANPEVTLLKEQQWKLPIVLYKVNFDRVKRLKMDVLMKMLLAAFQEADIQRAANLAEMLLVEELFIRDLIDKMQRTGLIQLEKKGYKLTAKGHDYLEQGIYDEEMDGDEAVVAFNAAHDDYFLAEEKSYSVAEETLPHYRCDVKKEPSKKRMQQPLSERAASGEEDGFQIIVSGITACTEQHTNFIACIEFQLYDEKQDIFYARVWNTMTGLWDETLEKQIEEQEVLKWREAKEEQEV